MAKVAKTSRNLKGTYVKILREVARFIAEGATKFTRRTGSTSGASAIMQGRVAALKAENEALRKKLVQTALVLHGRKERRVSASRRDRAQDGPATHLVVKTNGGTPQKHR